MSASQNLNDSLHGDIVQTTSHSRPLWTRSPRVASPAGLVQALGPPVPLDAAKSGIEHLLGILWEKMLSEECLRKNTWFKVRGK